MTMKRICDRCGGADPEKHNLFDCVRSLAMRVLKLEESRRASDAGKCPACGGDVVRSVSHGGRVLGHCSKCHAWLEPGRATALCTAQNTDLFTGVIYACIRVEGHEGVHAWAPSGRRLSQPVEVKIHAMDADGIRKALGGLRPPTTRDPIAAEKEQLIGALACVMDAWRAHAAGHMRMVDGTTFERAWSRGCFALGWTCNVPTAISGWMTPTVESKTKEALVAANEALALDNQKVRAANDELASDVVKLERQRDTLNADLMAAREEARKRHEAEREAQQEVERLRVRLLADDRIAFMVGARIRDLGNDLEAARRERDEWKKGVEDANRIAQEHARSADVATKLKDETTKLLAEAREERDHAIVARKQFDLLLDKYDRVLREACGYPDGVNPSDGHTWADEAAGLLRVARVQRDQWEETARMREAEADRCRRDASRTGEVLMKLVAAIHVAVPHAETSVALANALEAAQPWAPPPGQPPEALKQAIADMNEVAREGGVTPIGFAACWAPEPGAEPQRRCRKPIGHGGDHVYVEHKP